MGNPSVSSKIDPNVFTDPVCGMKVSPDKGNLFYSYKGCRYYFCAEACRKAFESNPLKYLSQKPSKRKGIWGRYLDRLNKATAGQQIKCH
ncbi:MAG: YHS domain-containing protein [Deltaproteobacteria bacterium]|nr:YHS domain-containing protein [Deltaproteobacteria bacterium]MBW1960312.1 YHS domain-containing protein [Deltaproteobacteria bacterium]MBW1994613.1 YHS domain-containing protein [Deltaproteobacteria bacterium]MBW2150209.1 YHS domain-containing protein [Deltaproteobacteria bacterium]